MTSQPTTQSPVEPSSEVATYKEVLRLIDRRQAQLDHYRQIAESYLTNASGDTEISTANGDPALSCNGPLTFTTTFLGIPIEGEIIRSNKDEQKPIEEFAPLMQAVLDDPTVQAFGWQQCTPYFNDGDECIFSAGSLWIRTDADPAPEAGDEWDWRRNHLVGNHHPTLGERPRVWDSVTRVHTQLSYTGPDEDRYDRCLALSNAISSGYSDNVLLDAFGDHAEITITRDGITVDTYDHE
ncbi:hypothetical protein ACQPYK_49485 (plasmid) [Streptosporangium sp. CA-135522]|uniref:hypothetical protein n=1 Tax=Streptosporangium sp. CA-135522 TaxID=3240072 RepID=UPI003D8E1094